MKCSKNLFLFFAIYTLKITTYYKLLFLGGRDSYSFSHCPVGDVGFAMHHALPDVTKQNQGLI